MGCGLGYFTRYLATISNQDARILGIDSNKKSIRTATLDTKRAGLTGVSYRVGDVHKLPLEDGYADLTCCRTLLAHLKDPLAAVREMARVTKTNGAVVAVERGKMITFYDPNDQQYGSLAQEEYESWVDGIRKLDGTEFWIGQKLPGIFQKAGLSKIKAEIQADAWLNTDPRRRLKDVEAQLRFDYSIFRKERHEERKYLLAGGMRNEKINSYLRVFESRTKALLSDEKKLRSDPSFYGDTFFIVHGTKTAKDGKPKGRIDEVSQCRREKEKRVVENG